LVVIMFSTYTARGAQITLDALTLGANDYVVKPSGTASPTEAMARIREEPLPRILTLCLDAPADGTIRPTVIAEPFSPAPGPFVSGRTWAPARTHAAPPSTRCSGPWPKRTAPTPSAS